VKTYEPHSGAKCRMQDAITGHFSYSVRSDVIHSIFVTTIQGHFVGKNVLTPLKAPSGLVLSPDRGTLFVGDSQGKFIWAFKPEGFNLSGAQPYCPLRTRPGEKASGVTHLATDTDGRIYAA